VWPPAPASNEDAHRGCLPRADWARVFGEVL